MKDSYSFKSPIGILTMSEENDELCELALRSDTLLPERYLQHSDLLFEAYTQINEYFAGKRREFDIPLKTHGTEFQQRVWSELRKIPYGETRSYQDIAAAVGNIKAVRAVGGANNRNNILIITPCHRVIHKNGDVSGFAHDVSIKKYLLDLEKSNS